jgi:hypothetical protein
MCSNKYFSSSGAMVSVLTSCAVNCGSGQVMPNTIRLAFVAPPISSRLKVERTNTGWLIVNVMLQLPVQSVPITTIVVSSNPVHGEVYLIQRYVIKFVSYLRQVGGFLREPRFPPPIKLNATI